MRNKIPLNSCSSSFAAIFFDNLFRGYFDDFCLMCAQCSTKPLNVSIFSFHLYATLNNIGGKLNTFSILEIYGIIKSFSNVNRILFHSKALK